MHPTIFFDFRRIFAHLVGNILEHLVTTGIVEVRVVRINHNGLRKGNFVGLDDDREDFWSFDRLRTGGHDVFKSDEGQEKSLPSQLSARRFKRCIVSFSVGFCLEKIAWGRFVVADGPLTSL